MSRKPLFACGVVASLLYVATDLVAALRYADYHSFSSHTISELMARGAPSERLVDPLFLLYDVLMIAFAAGVWMAAEGRRLHQWLAGLLAAVGVIGLLGPTWFEMNLRGTGNVASDMPHLLLTSALALFIVLAIAIGAFTRGAAFRWYSLATLLVLVISGALAALQGRMLAAGGATPWIGVTERLNIGAYLLWVAVLAVALHDDDEERSAAAPSPSSRGRPLVQAPIARR